MHGIFLILVLVAAVQSYEIEKITEPLLMGEGPHWNSLTQMLYFVDILNRTINLYDPATGQHNSTHIDGGAVTFIVPVAGTTDEFLVSTTLDIRHVIWDGHQDSTATSEILYSAIQGSDGCRFNDGKADRNGHLWAGTMGAENKPDLIVDRTGKLYEVSPYTSMRIHLENILISNGLAWTADGSVMYWTDTGDSVIESFDFDATSATPLSNRQVTFNFTENGTPGKPDGFTIDTDGNLWIACYGGYQVIVVNPNDGSVLRTIPIDISQVTSLTWGGPNLDDLYVTTGQKNLSADELEKRPDSGATYRITGLGARGYAGDNYVMYTNHQ